MVVFLSIMGFVMCWTKPVAKRVAHDHQPLLPGSVTFQVESGSQYEVPEHPDLSGMVGSRQQMGGCGIGDEEGGIDLEWQSIKPKFDNGYADARLFNQGSHSSPVTKQPITHTNTDSCSAV